MTGSGIEYKQARDIPLENILALYRANGWSSADKPQELYKALMNSHSLVTAWDGSRLVGLGNALSDDSLVVYYSHLLVLPTYQGQGIGHSIMRLLMAKYGEFHQQVVLADGKAVEFYTKHGFTRTGQAQALWIYHGHEHE
jgi:GNAT superfamily N-acetyltransferase